MPTMKKPTIYAKRRWRVYFTCRVQWPNLCAIDQGTVETQIAVKSIECTVPFTSHSDKGRPGLALIDAGNKGPVKRRDRRQRPDEPFWWIEVDGELEILDGRARIYQPINWEALRKLKVGERLGAFIVTKTGAKGMSLSAKTRGER
jgi:hypothetical protein